MLNFIKIILFTYIVFNAVIDAEEFISDYSICDKQLEPFSAPTKRQIELETALVLKSNLLAIGAKTKHLDWWNHIIDQEERGVFGYHAAKQEFRIFQDIIKMIFVEILELEIKNDFHFFRIPFDPTLFESETAADFLEIKPQPNDKVSPDRDQMLSMNYTLYGNSTVGTSCSIIYFSKNQSRTKIDYAKKLEFLFHELGIPLREISSLIRTGDSFVGFETGVLFQFTDLSHQTPNYHDAYELVDQLAYPSLPAGKYDYSVEVNLSEIFLADHPNRFDAHTGQLRLIMNTATTLNPYSPITIRRYDQIDPKIIEKYETLLRQRVQNLPKNDGKVEQYKQKLKAYWYAQDL
jgi:hypothetical protein